VLIHLRGDNFLVFIIFVYFLTRKLRNHYSSFFFFFTDTPTTEIYTLSLHDALPISALRTPGQLRLASPRSISWMVAPYEENRQRSEEHTSELQSRSDLVCRLLLEKKKK